MNQKYLDKVRQNLRLAEDLLPPIEGFVKDIYWLKISDNDIEAAVIIVSEEMKKTLAVGIEIVPNYDRSNSYKHRVTFTSYPVNYTVTGWLLEKLNGLGQVIPWEVFDNKITYRVYFDPKANGAEIIKTILKKHLYLIKIIDKLTKGIAEID